MESAQKMTTFDSQCKNQRKAFEQHVEEVEQITGARIAAVEGRFTTPSKAKGGSSTFDPEYDPTFEPVRPPESGPVITRWLAGEKVLPKNSDHLAATIIQANYRGYSARTKANVHRRIHHFQPSYHHHHPLPSLNHLGEYSSSMLEKRDDDDGSDLLASEDALAECQSKVQGINAMGDLRPLFAKLDRNGTGFVNRTQFAIVLRQSKDYKLPPEVFRAVLNAFDCKTTTNNSSVNGGGNLYQDEDDVLPASINYRAFISFAEFYPIEVTPVIVYLRNMFLPPTSLDTFAKYDTLGHGTISRVNLMDALRKLGYSSLPQEHMSLLANLYEISDDRVNYGTLVQFIAEQPASIKVFELEHSIRAHLLDLIRTKGVHLHRALSTTVDPKTARMRGFSCATDLFSALVKFGYTCCPFDDEEIQRQFYKYLDPTGIGISLDAFVAFVKKGKVTAGKYPPSTSTAPLVSIPKLRHRAGATVADVSRRFGDAYPLLRMFEHYDWRREGLVGSKSFQRVLQCSGFPFTSSEIAALIHNFSHGGQKVAYKRFFTWATCGKEIVKKDKKGHRKKQQILQHLNEDLTHRYRSSSSKTSTVEDVLHMLYKTLNSRNNSKWKDWGKSIEQILERADKHCTGRLSELQFRKCLDELGLDVTTRDFELLFSRFGYPLLYEPFLEELQNVGDGGLASSSSGDSSMIKQHNCHRDRCSGVEDRIEAKLLEKRAVNALLKALNHEFNTSEDPLKSLFEMLDTKERHAISATDLRYGLKALGEDISTRDSNVLVKILRCGGSGKESLQDVAGCQKNAGLITYNEFVQAIEQQQ